MSSIMMEIAEISNKLKEDLLENKVIKSCSNNFIGRNFSPIVTRSKTCSNNSEQKVDYRYNGISPKRKVKSNYEVENLLVNKKSLVQKKLETIYEDPIWKKGTTTLLGTSKVKRSLYLDREFRITSKQKSKFRKIKIKKYGKKFKPLKITDDEFKKKMLQIENYLNDTNHELNSNTDDLNLNIQMDLLKQANVLNGEID